jgi:O-antigen/teichoic acid export membrane protein
MNRNSIGKTTARNSIYSIIANTWYLLSRFLLTPFILHYLPLAEYGLWTLCFVVISFLALTSIGLEGTYIKYVAEFHARGENDKINRLLSTGLLLTFGLASFIMLVMWLAMPLILEMLKIETSLHQKASFVFMGTGLVFMLDISLSCFGRMLDGLQLMTLTAKVKLFTSFVELALIVIFLLLGWGIYGMMGAFLIRYILAIAFNMGFAFKMMPGLKVSVHYFDKPSCRLLISYGGKMQILGFIGIFMSTFDKIIITRLLGLAFTGMYEIGRKMPATGARIPTEISRALMPALSYLQGKKDMDEARMLFMSASRYMAMLSAPLFTYLFVAAPYAIYVWLGTGYENATVVMCIISAGVMVNLLTGAGSAAAKGFNRLDWELKYGVLNLLLCLLMTPVLAVWFGLAGAAGGVAGSTAIASVYFIWLTNRFFHISLIQYYKQIFQPVLVSIASAIALAYMLPLFITVGTTSRFTAIFVLIGAGAGHLLLSVVLLVVTRGILSPEKEWLARRMNSTKKSTRSS